MRLVSLVSGGIDSPASTYMMLKRGAEIVAVHFDNRPFTDDNEVGKAMDLVMRLEEVVGRAIRTYLVPHGPTQARVARNCRRNLQCVLCRRMMFRIGERIAAGESAGALVTGESLGQVASQTLRNVMVESGCLSIPVLRPLIGLDKIEIEAIAKEAGTFETSIRPGMCCTITPKKPSTQARLAQVGAEEARLDMGVLVEAAMEGAAIMDSASEWSGGK